MECKHWGKCGGCSLPLDYETQLEQKICSLEKMGIAKLQEIYASPKKGYRSRAEFRIYHNDSGVHLAMQGAESLVIIQQCPILLPYLWEKLQNLLVFLNAHRDFAFKLFGVEIMGGINQNCLITLLYHRKLDQSWEMEAMILSQTLGIQVIGRSKGQKVILGEEGIWDEVELEGRKYQFLRYDNAFSQPNPFVNLKMLEFALFCADKEAKDLLELYCGSGNFTLALSQRFRKIFATEVAKSSIKALHSNLMHNRIENIKCVRLSGEESIEALSFKREFRRLKGMDLSNYDFSHLLVDPPRSGIGDRAMLEFMGRFPNIIYISCNPWTLKKDLEILERSHKIVRFVAFDQFPYTHHLECGALLKQR